MFWVGHNMFYKNATYIVFREMCCQPVYIVTVHPCENYTLIEAIGIQCATPVLAKLMSPKDQMEFCQYDNFECTLFDLKTFTCKKRIRYSSHLKIKKQNLAKLIHVVVINRLILSR